MQSNSGLQKLDVELLQNKRYCCSKNIFHLII